MLVVRLAKIMTIGFLVALIWAVYDTSANYNIGLEELCIFIFFLICIGLNYTALQVITHGKSFLSEIWPFILFKRLALQEKKKIEELENKNAR